MSRIVISIDMEYTNDGTDSAVLIKVVNSENDDITEKYRTFCGSKNYDTTKKADIENAAIPFIKENEAILP